MDATKNRPYWLRFLMASIAAFVLVAACSISMQPHAVHDPERLLSILLAILIFAIPCGAIAALMVKRSDLWLVLASQVMTVVAIASWFAMTGA